MTSREDKIQALRDLMAGRISTSQLPKPMPESSVWHYDGMLFIRLDPATKQPHSSGLQLTEYAFYEYARTRPDTLHIVLDSCTMEAGSIQAFELYDETQPAEQQDKLKKTKIAKIGVQLPLHTMIPVKASQWHAL